MSFLNLQQQVSLLTKRLKEQDEEILRLEYKLKDLERYLEDAEEDKGLIDALFWYFSELDIRVTKSIIKDVIRIVTTT